MDSGTNQQDPEEIQVKYISFQQPQDTNPTLQNSNMTRQQQEEAFTTRKRKRDEEGEETKGQQGSMKQNNSKRIRFNQQQQPEDNFAEKGFAVAFQDSTLEQSLKNIFAKSKRHEFYPYHYKKYQHNSDASSSDEDANSSDDEKYSDNEGNDYNRDALNPSDYIPDSYFSSKTSEKNEHLFGPMAFAPLFQSVMKISNQNSIFDNFPHGSSKSLQNFEEALSEEREAQSHAISVLQSEMEVHLIKKREKIWSETFKNSSKTVVKARNHVLRGGISKFLAFQKISERVVSEVFIPNVSKYLEKKDLLNFEKNKLLAHNLTKDIGNFWKKFEKEISESKKKKQKEESEAKKREEEMQEQKRQQRKLDFLLTQTELYNHFIVKKNQKLNISNVEKQKSESIEQQANKAPEEGSKLPKVEEKIEENMPKLSFELEENEEEGITKARAVELAKAAAEAQKQRIYETFDKSFEKNTEGMDVEQQENQENLEILKEPSFFNGKLKNYQLKGLSWLVSLWEQGINGILADEMGLGKTIQIIAFLAHLAERENQWGPVLVVAPSSTLHNWKSEFENFFPKYKTLGYWGGPKERKGFKKFFSDPENKLSKSTSPFHVAITSYGLILEDEKFLSKINWQFLILDEAHAIKSAKSVRWNTLLRFKCRNRILLTGTPIQNNMAELWALLHFIMPGLFDSHAEFAEWFSKDIESSITGEGSSGAGGSGTTKINFNDKQLRRLHMILKPFMLRRVKKDVESEMAAKIEKVVYVDLAPKQRAMYSAIKQSLSKKILSSGKAFLTTATTTPNSATSVAVAPAPAVSDFINNKKSLLNYVMQFRKVCNHPFLFGKPEIASPWFGVQRETPIIKFLPPEICGFVPRLIQVNRNLIDFEIPKLLYRGGGVGVSKSRNFSDTLRGNPNDKFESWLFSEKWNIFETKDKILNSLEQDTELVSKKILKESKFQKNFGFSIPKKQVRMTGEGFQENLEVLTIKTKTLFSFFSFIKFIGGYSVSQIAFLLNSGSILKNFLIFLNNTQSSLQNLLKISIFEEKSPISLNFSDISNKILCNSFSENENFKNIFDVVSNFYRGEEISSKRFKNLVFNVYFPSAVCPPINFTCPTDNGFAWEREYSPIQSRFEKHLIFGISTAGDALWNGSMTKISSGVPQTIANLQNQLKTAILQQNAQNNPENTETSVAAKVQFQHFSKLEKLRKSLPHLLSGNFLKSWFLDTKKQIDLRSEEFCILETAEKLFFSKESELKGGILSISPCSSETLKPSQLLNEMIVPERMQIDPEQDRIEKKPEDLKIKIISTKRTNISSLSSSARTPSSKTPSILSSSLSVANLQSSKIFKKFGPKPNFSLFHKITEEIASGTLSNFQNFIRKPDLSTLIAFSSKFQKLDEILKNLQEENEKNIKKYFEDLQKTPSAPVKLPLRHKALIFSQMTKMLDLLEIYLYGKKFKFLRMDGSTPLNDRRDLVRKFQASEHTPISAFSTDDDTFAFLLSTRAGGQGITLTAADTVIFFDSDWNPTADAQAMDRVHRIGQTKQVTVYRIVVRNSVEERMLKIAQQKSEIQSTVYSGGFNMEENTVGVTNVENEISNQEVVSMLMNELS